MFALQALYHWSHFPSLRKFLSKEDESMYMGESEVLST
jgi:hypothetical protein